MTRPDAMTFYLALLRGINVGGKNQIRMPDLAACFESLGFQQVHTYIQSGNVIFDAGEKSQASLPSQIEEILSKTFHYDSKVVIRSYEEFKNTVTQAPKEFGSDPDGYRYDVIFLKEPLTSVEFINSITTKVGVDQVDAGQGVVYFSRLASKATQSHLTRIVGTPIYQKVTIRNWNTTIKLLELMETIRN